MNTLHLSARGTRRAIFLALPAGVLALGACSTDVTTPDVVPPAATAGASALPGRLSGAVGDFLLAYAGYNNGNSGEGMALVSGLMADEYIWADQFIEHAQIDQRQVANSNNINETAARRIFRSLSSAQTTADAYVAADLADDAGRARALNIAGFDYLLIGENYCSGMPVSSYDETGTIHLGPSQTTAELLTNAEQRFDSAIAVATRASDDLMLNAARVGKARALVGLGRLDEARQVAKLVPADFLFQTEQGTSNDREKSGNFVLTWVSPRYTVADNEGINGLPFVSADDPRVKTEYLGPSQFDNEQSEINAPLMYSSYTSPSTIASGVEAQLIVAEADLTVDGDYAAAKAILDNLRASVGLSPLVPATTFKDQVMQLFTERGFWLFGTAHRLGDLRRLLRDPYATRLGLSQADVFPTGTYFKGGTYGDQVSLIVPLQEQQNTKFDPKSCDPTKP